MSAGVVALLGSGETAPGMTKVHRDLLARRAPVRAVTLDTAYGFQQNVPQMTEKLVDYFSTSLHTALEPLHLTSYDDASEVQRAVVKRAVSTATYVFAGPGSPSWALAQWRPLGLVDDLHAALDADAVVCFASAAALTLGAYTAPIYEIYKVGVPEPYWLEGLDLMGRLGLRCVVVPHFDNREGANYDTRYCYLGERRLRQLEAALPEDVATLGVDEHTAAVIDLGADTIAVRGRGHAHWRLGDETRVLTSKSPTPLSELRLAEPAVRQAAPEAPPASGDLDELGRAALAGGHGALDAVAELVRRAQGARPGLIDPEPLVASLLALRAQARSTGDYELSDVLRAALAGAGVEIRDGANGATWSISPGG